MPQHSQGNELADVRRHHNEALARVKEQSEALLHALSYQKGRGEADDDAVLQVRGGGSGGCGWGAGLGAAADLLARLQVWACREVLRAKAAAEVAVAGVMPSAFHRPWHCSPMALACTQVKAVAEIAVGELKARLQEREHALAALEASMSAAQVRCARVGAVQCAGVLACAGAVPVLPIDLNIHQVRGSKLCLTGNTARVLACAGAVDGAAQGGPRGGGGAQPAPV